MKSILIILTAFFVLIYAIFEMSFSRKNKLKYFTDLNENY